MTLAALGVLLRAACAFCELKPKPEARMNKQVNLSRFDFMSAKFELEGQILCRARDKTLTKAWWQANANKLALIALETQTILDLESVTHLSYSLAVVRNPEIKDLNQNYRKINKETDVLSFPALQAATNMPLKLPTLELGDIVISIDKLKEQAEGYGHSEQREGAFLFVHGFLHLLGYDHEDPAEEREMFKLQDKILKEAGFLRANDVAK